MTEEDIHKERRIKYLKHATCAVLWFIMLPIRIVLTIFMFIVSIPIGSMRFLIALNDWACHDRRFNFSFIFIKDLFLMFLIKGKCEYFFNRYV